MMMVVMVMEMVMMMWREIVEDAGLFTSGLQHTDVHTHTHKVHFPLAGKLKRKQPSRPWELIGIGKGPG